MKRILIILPISIAGTLIMESFALGFEANNCRVLSRQIQELTEEETKFFKSETFNVPFKISISPEILFSNPITKLCEEDELVSNTFFLIVVAIFTNYYKFIARW